MGQAERNGNGKPKRPEPMGASMSTKQLARTAVDGKKLHFRWHPDAEGIEGYLCGMDDFHWMVVTPEGAQRLIHKGSAPIIEIADDPTFDDEPRREALEAVVGPFRTAMQRTHFVRAVAQKKESA